MAGDEATDVKRTVQVPLSISTEFLEPALVPKSQLKYERNLGRAEGQQVVFVSRVCCGTVGPFLCFSQNVWADPENFAAWMLVLILGVTAAISGRMWHKLDKAAKE